MSSHDVVRQVRRICRTRKVGHAGTLDPMATGVLPIAIGDGTKILQFLFTDSKSYRATLKLGETTDTLDSEGQLLTQSPVPDFTVEQIESACSAFCGEIMQVPPMYSALKRNGVPLYKLAREGKIVEREARPVTINRLELVRFEPPFVTIDVDCSKGTYIRTLIDDIGHKLGCGAHMTELRRTRSGSFSIDDCMTLEQLQKLQGEPSGLLTLDQALAEYPAVIVQPDAAEPLCCGVPPHLNQVAGADSLEEGQLVRLQFEGQLAAMARYTPQRQRETRGDFELVRVFVGR